MNIIAIVVAVNTKKVSAADMPTTTAQAIDAKYVAMGGIALPDPSKSSTGYTVISALAAANNWDFVSPHRQERPRSGSRAGGAANAARAGETAMCWVNEDVTAKGGEGRHRHQVGLSPHGVPTVVDAQAMVKGAKNVENAKAVMAFLNAKETHERSSATRSTAAPAQGRDAAGRPAEARQPEADLRVEPGSVVNAKFEALRK